MRAARGFRIVVAALWLAALGCGQSVEKAAVYRANKLLYEARQAEVKARLSTERPDSTTLLSLRERFLKVRESVSGDLLGVSGRGEETRAYRLLRAVANAEAQGARLAMEAGRADLALPAALQLKEDAGEEPVTARQAAFLALESYRALGRYDDAIAEMKSILKRFPPSETRAADEDPILSIPETIVKLKRGLGDQAGAESEMREALAYYESLLHDPFPATVLAQARARALMTALDLDMRTRALAHADTLEQFIRARQELRPMMAEVQFAQAKIRTAIDANAIEAVAMLQRIAIDFPESPFASRALFEAATQLESAGRYREALEAYQALLQRFPNAPEQAPISLYRIGLVQDRLGQWEVAKATLEQVPVRYPQSMAAAEAPMAVIQHYARMRDPKAAKGYIPNAIETYRGLIRLDTNGQMAPLFRARIFQLYDANSDSTGVYGMTEEMVREHPGHPFTAQILLAAGKAATKYGNVPRAAGYLNLFLAKFPKSPLVGEVKRELREHGF